MNVSIRPVALPNVVRVGLKCVSVVIPDHTHVLVLMAYRVTCINGISTVVILLRQLWFRHLFWYKGNFLIMFNFFI